MRKTTLIFAILAIVLCGGAQTGSSLYCDTTGISTFNALVNGKLMPATLTGCSGDKDFLKYRLHQPFMENDTQYICREYHLWKCDACSTYDTCTISYYIIPRQNKDHIASVLKTYYVRDPDFNRDTFLFDEYRYWRDRFPTFTPSQRDLGDMPRHWFAVKKYQGQYVLTTDYNYGCAFTDSMIVYYGMEHTFFHYGEVRNLDSGVYYYENFGCYHDGRLVKHQNWLHPSTLVKGLYVLSSLSPAGAIYQTLVTPQENLHYFNLIGAKLCEVDDYLDYDTVDYDAHTDPALMAEIRNLHKSLKEQANKGKKKNETEENPRELIFVEDLELFPDNGNSPAKSFSDTVSGEPPFMFAEEMPEFPGGEDSLKVFIKRNLQWPNTPSAKTGIVLVEFIVEKDGTVTHPTISISLMPEYDKEALRLVGLMPKWKPARTQGEPVRCYYKMPVRFTR